MEFRVSVYWRGEGLYYRDTVLSISILQVQKVLLSYRRNTSRCRNLLRGEDWFVRLTSSRTTGSMKVVFKDLFICGENLLKEDFLGNTYPSLYFWSHLSKSSISVVLIEYLNDWKKDPSTQLFAESVEFEKVLTLRNGELKNEKGPNFKHYMNWVLNPFDFHSTFRY